MCYDALAFDNMAGEQRASFAMNILTLDLIPTTDKSILVERAVNMELALYIKSERQTGDAYRTSEHL